MLPCVRAKGREGYIGGRRFVSTMSQALTPPPGMLEQLRAFDQNARWAHEHLDELLKHLGKFVAVDGGRIIATAATELLVRKKMRKRPAAYVTFVHSPDLAWVCDH